LSRAATTLQRTRRQLSEKGADLTALFEDRAALQINLDQVATLSAQTLREYEVLALQHRETEEALLDSSRQVEILSQEQSQLSDQNAVLEEQIASMTEQIRVLTSAVFEAKSIIAELERESSYQVLDMESQLNSTVSEASMLRGDFASVSYELSQKRSELQQMEKRIEVRMHCVSHVILLSC
jgi:chromosome segregation ATPase